MLVRGLEGTGTSVAQILDQQAPHIMLVAERRVCVEPAAGAGGGGSGSGVGGSDSTGVAALRWFDLPGLQQLGFSRQGEELHLDAGDPVNVA